MNIKLSLRRLMWGIAGGALAAGAASAAPPLITQDTRTQGTGRYQFQAVGEEWKERATRRKQDGIGLELAYGAGDNLDLSVGLPWYRSGPDGIGDVALDAKWRLLQRDALSLALKPGLTLPTGNERKGRGTGRMTAGSLFIVSYEPGAIGVHGHAGYWRNENKLGERKDLRELAGAATYRVGAVRFVGELTRQTNPVPGGRTVRYSTVGGIWSVTRDLDLSVGWREGHGGAPQDDILHVGAQVRW